MFSNLKRWLHPIPNLPTRNTETFSLCWIFSVKTKELSLKQGRGRGTDNHKIENLYNFWLPKNSVVPHYLRGICSPLDTKIRGCSSPLYKMAQTNAVSPPHLWVKNSAGTYWKIPCVNGPVQIKPMSFQGQLYILEEFSSQHAASPSNRCTPAQYRKSKWKEEQDLV